MTPKEQYEARRAAKRADALEAQAPVRGGLINE